MPSNNKFEKIICKIFCFCWLLELSNSERLQEARSSKTFSVISKPSSAVFSDDNSYSKSSCFLSCVNLVGKNIVSRVLAELNLNSIARNLDFNTLWRVKGSLMIAPYISSTMVKADQNLISKIVMNIFSANYRHGHKTKFSNIDMFEFINTKIDIVIIQARNAYFSVLQDLWCAKLINKIKTLFVMKNGDNFVSYKQTYDLTKKISKNHSVYFYYSEKLNHDDIIFQYWSEKLHIIKNMINNNDKKRNGVLCINNVDKLSIIHRILKCLNKIKTSNIDNLGMFKENIVAISGILENIYKNNTIDLHTSIKELSERYLYFCDMLSNNKYPNVDIVSINYLTLMLKLLLNEDNSYDSIKSELL